MVIRPALNRRSGMSLVETMIAVTVAALLLGAVVTSLQAATGLFESTNSELDIDRRVRRATQELRQALENARGSTIDPALPEAPLGGPIPHLDSFEFQSVTGWDTDDVTLGPTERLFLRMERSENDNGVDDDGDGLIDEMEVVHLTDTSAATPIELVVAKGVLEWYPGETVDNTDENGNGLVDEPGFSITEDNGKVTVRLAAGLVDERGTVLVRTAEIVINTQP